MKNKLDSETQKKLDNLVGIMNSFHKQGMSLKEIYDKTVWAHGKSYGPFVFQQFISKNKKNKKFIEEFNKTSFL